jgi:two-component system, NtrC family, sensor kinase
MDTQVDLDIHRFIFKTSAQLRDASDPDKVLRHYLRSTVEVMEADQGYIAVLDPGDAVARKAFAQPQDATCNFPLVTALLRGEPAGVPSGMICARLTRRGRSWCMIVLERHAGEFPGGYPRALAHVARVVSELIERMDQGRLAEVRARIDNMMMRELPPKDLYYQILDGLHQLTRYDHSAALWIWAAPESSLELAAEQIAWRKMKSPIIGTAREFPVALQGMLGDGVVYGFDRTAERWSEWTPHGAVELARLLDLGGESSDRPPENAMLCASLGTRHGPLGILKLSALAPGAFCDYEVAIVERFTALASLVLKRAQTVEALQARMLKVERQNALAHLARGVAHDINNALGEVVPLVQQIRSELHDGTLDLQVLDEDLQRVEHSLRVTRGIFGRMMRFARGATRVSGPSDVRQAFDAVRDVLQESLSRSAIQLHASFSDKLPPVRCGQSDLERLLLNLMSNARDAMPNGGTLTVEVQAYDHQVVLLIADDGIGMSAEALRETEAPFFTTKEHGTGLGLSTCRSIVAEAGGDLVLESEPGKGTRVTARLSVAPMEDSEG